MILCCICGKIRESENEKVMKMELLNLFWVFAKIGAVTFGGGLAMLPILQREIVDKRNWATEEELLDYYAIGQCTPGIIAVNTATFIGYKRKGILGGIMATLGVIFPSIVIITIIAAFVQNFLEYEFVNYAFNGIRVCVCVLIFDAVLKLWKKAVIDMPSAFIFLAAFLVSFLTNLPIIGVVIGAGAAGLCVNIIRRKIKNKEEQ